jgi:uncharacterized protein (TIGR03086 family)
MTASEHLLAPADPASLLDRALGFALGAAHAVTRERMSGPTPCAGWDLRALLLHMTDSLELLSDGLGTGRVGMPEPLGFGSARRTAGDPVAALRGQAARLRGLSAGGLGRGPVRIADAVLEHRILLGVGAVEVAVHGWDVCRACGLRRPIPPDLAGELTAVCVLVVTADTRRPAFAPPVAVPSGACPSDRLVAFLGRDPDFRHDASQGGST